MSNEQKLIGKVLSTKGPALHLIPMEALVGLADRFEKGVERKGEGAWNALSANQECLVDKEFLLDRISHLITHALKFRDQLVRGVKPDEESMYDNAGAVAFGGALLLCAAREVAFEAKVEWPSGQGTPAYDESPLLVDVLKECPKVGEKSAKDYHEYGKDWSLKAGLTYPTVGPHYTGTLVEFHRPGLNAPPQFFSKTRSDVAWTWDGTPIKVNMSMSDRALEEFRISYGAEGVVN